MKEQSNTLSIKDCYESPTNPRGPKFEGKDFDDLVASVNEKGVLMPVLARAVGKKYEIVAGNRRFRAASLAGLTHIPARVVEMTDTEAREAQIVENLQRADVHPLEEGKAYRDLIEQSGYDLAAVAAKVGKSEAFVRDRLVLTNLVKAGQAMFRAADIHIGHAALIARLDEKQQKDAIAYLQEETNYDSTATYATTKDLREWIQARVLEDSMNNPPWRGDEQMKQMLGGCEECKGKGGDLFGKRVADACTNPKCYAQRLVAYIAIKIAETPELVQLSGNYSTIEDKPGTGSRKEVTSKKDACDYEEKGIVVVGHDMGRILRFCSAPECAKHWAHSAPSGGYKPTAKEKEARKKAREAEVKKRERDASAVEAALAKASWPLTEKQLDVLFTLALKNASHDVKQGICKRREWEAPKRKDWHGRDYQSAIAAKAKKMKPKEKMGLTFELLLQGFSLHYNEGRASALKDL